MLMGEMRGTPNFQFETAWLQEDDCVKVVEEAWNSAFDNVSGLVGEAVKHVGRQLWVWDKQVLGELKTRIKRAKKDLENCRRGAINQTNVTREQVLKYKLSRLEDQHNVFWKQRAHANWLKYGDWNTGYFHAFASERKRMNVIKKLKREGGGIVNREEEIGSYIANHYKTYSSLLQVPKMMNYFSMSLQR